MALLIYLIHVVVIFYWQLKRVKRGDRTKKKAISLYAVYTLAPVILYGAVFVGLVGIEELTGTAIIGEGYARSLVFVLLGGIAVTLITSLVFSMVVLLNKTVSNNPD